MHYTATMSYAGANQNSVNRYDLSERYLERTGKQVNQSLDLMERLLPKLHKNNIADFSRLNDKFGQANFLTKRKWALSRQLNAMRYTDRMLVKGFRELCDIVMVAAFKMMEDVLRINFIDGWNEMDLRDCVHGSLELSRMLRKSIDVDFQESWLPSLHIRLEEKLIASNRAMVNLERVHDAYSNAVTLLNYNATSNGSYNSFYLTAALFNQRTEELEVYSQLDGDVKRYIESIEGLIRIHFDVAYNMSTPTGEFVNHTKDLLQTSIEYIKHLDAYESLVIRQPLQRVKEAKDTFAYYRSRPNVYAVERLTYMNVFTTDYEQLLNKTTQIYSTNVTGAVADYLLNLVGERPVSKINIANFITSNRIRQMLEEYQVMEMKFVETKDILDKQVKQFDIWRCQFIAEAKSEPLLMALYTSVYNHFNVTTGSERAAMRKYFKFLDSYPSGNLFLGGVDTDEECPNMIHLLASLKNLDKGSKAAQSLRAVSRTMRGFEPFLDKTRLDGSFLRYVL